MLIDKSVVSMHKDIDYEYQNISRNAPIHIVIGTAGAPFLAKYNIFEGGPCSLCSRKRTKQKQKYNETKLTRNSGPLWKALMGRAQPL